MPLVRTQLVFVLFQSVFFFVFRMSDSLVYFNMPLARNTDSHLSPIIITSLLDHAQSTMQVVLVFPKEVSSLGQAVPLLVRPRLTMQAPPSGENREGLQKSLDRGPPRFHHDLRSNLRPDLGPDLRTRIT